jgi:hypothetical protein
MSLRSRLTAVRIVLGFLLLSSILPAAAGELE